MAWKKLAYIGIDGMEIVGTYELSNGSWLESLSSLSIILFISAIVKFGAPPDSPINGKFV